MKKIKLAVAAMVIAAGAFGAYAFTNSEKSAENEAKFVTTYYGLNQSTQMYEKLGTTPPDVSDNCQPATIEHRCAIGFSSDQGTSLDPDNLPATPNYQSPGNGWYSEE